MLDYSDSPEVKTEEAELHHQRQRDEVRDRAALIEREFDAIHGHFLPEKHRYLFRSIEMVSFVRDPYQQAISAYEHAMRATSSRHLGWKQVHGRRMNIIDFIAAFPEKQPTYLRSISFNDMNMLGITERYSESVSLFGRRLGINLSEGRERENVNPLQQGAPYIVSPDVRKAVDAHSPGELMLYRKAIEYFNDLALKYNI